MAHTTGFNHSAGFAARGRSRATRVSIQLVCTTCKARNYRTTKKRDKTVELKKFCKTCGKHVMHRESK